MSPITMGKWEELWEANECRGGLSETTRGKSKRRDFSCFPKVRWLNNHAKLPSPNSRQIQALMARGSERCYALHWH